MLYTILIFLMLYYRVFHNTTGVPKRQLSAVQAVRGALWSSEDAMIMSLSQTSMVWSAAQVSSLTGLSIDQVVARVAFLVSLDVPIMMTRGVIRFSKKLDTLVPSRVCDAMAISDEQLQIYWQIDSTNNAGLRLSSSSPVEFLLAESQTAGRGRRAKQWQTLFGDAVLMSYRHVASRSTDFSSFSLLLTLTIVECIHAQFPELSCAIKWPNDIYLCGQKLMGVLVDVVHGVEQTTLVAGVGCNLHVEQGALEDHAIGLSALMTRYDKHMLAVHLMRACRLAKEYCVGHSLDSFRSRYDQCHLLHRQWITFDDKHTSRRGWVEGLSPSGKLMVRCDNQHSIALDDADVANVRLASVDLTTVT